MATFVDEYSKWATGAEAPANGNATGLHRTPFANSYSGRGPPAYNPSVNRTLKIIPYRLDRDG